MMTKKSFLQSKNKTSKRILDLLHLDLVGPFEVPSYGNAKYFLTIVDDHSRQIFIRFLKQKGDLYKTFKEFMNMVETETGLTIRAVRSNNGSKFCGKLFNDTLKERGILCAV
jgi:transposase InsO family protein